MSDRPRRWRHLVVGAVIVLLCIDLLGLWIDGIRSGGVVFVLIFVGVALAILGRRVSGRGALERFIADFRPELADAARRLGGRLVASRWHGVELQVPCAVGLVRMVVGVAPPVAVPRRPSEIQLAPLAQVWVAHPDPGRRRWVLSDWPAEASGAVHALCLAVPHGTLSFGGEGIVPQRQIQLSWPVAAEGLADQLVEVLPLFAAAVADPIDRSAGSAAATPPTKAQLRASDGGS